MVLARRLMAAAAQTASPVHPNIQPRGALIWEDNFDGAAGSLVDSTKWSYETGMLRNNELQYYKPSDADNASLDGNGNLVIRVQQEAFGGADYTSASLLTLDKFDFLYGYIEARIRTPTGSGVWPAFWTEGVGGSWPTHGEIDIMEKINSDPGTNVNIHAGPTHWNTGEYSPALPRNDDYNIYAARISPGKVEFYLNEVLIYTVTTADVPSGEQWPFDTFRQFIRLNVAMGGDWPGTPDGTAVLPLAMYVDYVRVYEYEAASDMPASTGNEVLLNRVVGPTADNGTVKIKTRTTGLGGGGQSRLAVGTDQAVSQNVRYTAAVTPNAQGDVFHTLTNLTRGETYYYRVQMNSTTDSNSMVGKIRVAPSTPTSFAFNFGSCADSVDPPAFAAILARDDELFIHMGDMWYADDTGQGIANFRNRMNTQLNATNQGRVYATTALSYTPSDHDAAMKNNSVGTVDTAGVATFNQAYRENFPMPLVQPTSGVYHTFVYGRIRFINIDSRTFKSASSNTDNSSKTILGTTQKQWFKTTVTNATEPVLVIVTDVPWTGPTDAGEDDWGGYNTERVELGNFINASGKKAVFLGGDMHAVAHSSGSAYGRNIPNYQAAPLENSSSIKGAPWDAVYPTSGSSVVSQYGRVVVTDTGGATITLAFTGYSSNNTVRVSRTDTFTI